jgi:hypothetical protein
MTKKLTVVLSQGRNACSARPALEGDLLAALMPRPNLEMAIIPHLYDLEPEGAGMQYLRSVAGDMIVLAWLYPRAIYWVLDANRVRGRMGRTAFFPEEELEIAPAAPSDKSEEAPTRAIWCFDLRAVDEAEPLLAEIERIALEVTGEPLAAVAAGAAADDGKIRIAESTRHRWYPVIDYGRCTNCLECLNFCLFGTFGLDESGRLFVEQPDTCRSGCPACSRVCPPKAIMFPHHADPAIAGDPHAPVQGFSLDLKQLFEATSPADLAAAERDRALAEKAAAETPKAEKPEVEKLKPVKPTPNQTIEKHDLDDLVNGVDEMEL